MSFQYQTWLLPPKVLRNHPNALFVLAFLSTPIFLGFALGLHVTDVSLMTLVIGGQCLTGFVLCRLASRNSISDLQALFLSAPIGIGVHTIIDQLFVVIFRPTPFPYLGLVGLSILLAPRSKLNLPRNPWCDFSLIPAVVLSCLLFAGLFNSSENPAILFFAVACIIPFALGEFLRFTRFRTYQLHFVTMSFIFVILLFRGMRHHLGRFSPTFFRPLLFGSDDQIFSEQMSSSIARFGILDNTSALGRHIRYHWLTLGWSGLTSRIAGAEPWIGTLHVIPIASPIIIGLSTFALVAIKFNRQARTKMVVGVLAAPLLLASSWSFLDGFGAIWANNTSNLSSHIWLIPGVVLVADGLGLTDISMRFALPIISGFLMISKGPYAAVLAAVIVSLLCSKKILRLNQSAQPTVFTLLLCLIAMLSTFLLFILANSNNSTSIPSIADLKSRLPWPLYPFNVVDSRILNFLLVASCWQIYRFWSIGLLLSRTHRRTGFVSFGLLIGAMATILLEYRDSEYFFNASIVGLAVISLLVVLYMLDNFEFVFTRWTIVVVPAICTTFCLISLLASAKSLGYFAPLVALLVTSIAIRSSSFNSKGFLSLTSQLNETKSSTNKILFAVGVLSLLTTSSFFSYHYQVRQLISQREQTPQVLTEYVAELNWIRSHTDSEAILITNLFLCPKNVLLSECSEFMKDKTGLSSRVVAASTQRRVLIEGPRFHAPVERFPRWISDRLDVVYSILNGKPNALKSLSRTNQNIYFVLSKTSARIAVDQGWIGVNFRNNLNVLGSSIHESESFSIFDISNFSKLVDTSG